MSESSSEKKEIHACDERGRVREKRREKHLFFFFFFSGIMSIAKEILLRECVEVSIDIVFGHERCQQKRFAVKAHLIEFYVG